MKIILYPGEVLFQVAESVEPGELDDIRALVKSMTLIMRMYNGAGLAAPQIGISKRVIVWEDFEDGGYAINPVITFGHGKVTTREGCLSLPNIQRDIKRKRMIEFCATDLTGNTRFFEVKNQLSITIQHEIDHLNGVTILDNFRRRRL